MASLPSFTLEEIKKHNTAESLWLVIEGKVYDVTSFRKDHPGGEEVLLDNAGTDATGVFQDVGHSPDAIKTRDGYLIGYVSGEEPSESSSCRVCGTHCNKLALAIGAVAIVGILLFAYKKYY